MNKNYSGLYRILIVFLCIVFAGCGKSVSSLEADFKNPPESAKPRTWLHVMSGNMNKDGLTKDLTSIKEVGIGGVVLFNVTQGIPNGPVKYNSEGHHEMIQHAAIECERLGLAFGVHNCDGWSSSGGPWITPDESMKMVVWSELVVDGGRQMRINLPQPSIREGLYEDIAVLAYPALLSEVQDHYASVEVSSSDENFDIPIAVNNRIDDATVLSKVGSTDPWIQFDYGQPHTVRSVCVVLNDRLTTVELQVSDDGRNFSGVKDLYKVRTGKGEWVIVDHFEPITARYFRLRFNQTTAIKNVALSGTYTIQNFLGRTSMSRMDDLKLLPIGEPEAAMIIAKEEIIVLTDSMQADGVLNALLPEGKWTVMRFGYTSTGAFNHPASDEGRGLECDKFKRESLKIHYDSFVKRVVNNLKHVAPHAFQYVQIDSYEMGGQNWTDDFEYIFKDANDYDILPFLPLFAGKFVGNAEVSEGVLSDLRHLHCDLMTENYYGYFTKLCNQDGLKSYIEPYGFGPVNDLDVGGKADMVMGEFWMNKPFTQIASSVSAGRIYGKDIISAEAFTTSPGINWKGHPAMAKASGDRAWVAGINEFMFHRFVHQANTHVKPGLTMNRWGFHFDRTQTWWNNSGKDWFRYIARGSYMLRQGVPVSDLLIYVGESAPNSVLYREDFVPAIPVGTNFDCVNTDVLVNRIDIEDGHLVLPEGTKYRILVLNNCDLLSLETVKRIFDVAQSGIPVIGAKPSRIRGREVSDASKKEFFRLVNETWSLPNVFAENNWSRVYSEINLQPDFFVEGRPDIEFIHRVTPEEEIYFFYNPDSVPRVFESNFRVVGKIPEVWNPMTGEIIKLAQFESVGSHTRTWIDLNGQASTFVVFRETSKNIDPIVSVRPHGASGSFSYTDSNKSIISTAENGKYFIKFQSGENKELLVDNVPGPIGIEGKWEVEFLKEHGYEALHNFDALTDWRDYPEDPVKYYSGTAIYRKSFKLPETSLNGAHKVILDLGRVDIVAGVKLNGKCMGVLWLDPFEVSITDALVSGDNYLEISLTNQWSNRLIGDERFPKQDGGYKLEGQFPKGLMVDWYVNNEPMPQGLRTTFCSGNFYRPNDELMPSGLIGPVAIRFEKNVSVD